MGAAVGPQDAKVDPWWVVNSLAAFYLGPCRLSSGCHTHARENRMQRPLNASHDIVRAAHWPAIYTQAHTWSPLVHANPSL